MAGAGHRLSADDHAAISAAVEQAERRSAGEIVTILTDQSDRYYDVALAWAALATLTKLTVLSLFPQPILDLVDRVLGRWSHEWDPQAVLVLAALTAMATFAGALVVQLWRPLRMRLRGTLHAGGRLWCRASRPTRS